MQLLRGVTWRVIYLTNYLEIRLPGAYLDQFNHLQPSLLTINLTVNSTGNLTNNLSCNSSNNSPGRSPDTQLSNALPEFVCNTGRYLYTL